MHPAALPGLLSRAALRLLESALEPAAVPSPSSQLASATLSVLALLRLLLPLLSSAETAVLLPQHRAKPTSGNGKAGPRSRAPSPERASSGAVRESAKGSLADDLAAGALTELVLRPMSLQRASTAEVADTQLECAGCIAQRAAVLLVAAVGGGDPRDELLERLLPLWLPLFTCSSAARAAYADAAPAPAGGAEIESPEARYWAIVRVLYSHVAGTLGVETARAVVSTWEELEHGLQAHTGWQADEGSGSAEAHLALRHSLQVR